MHSHPGALTLVSQYAVRDIYRRPCAKHLPVVEFVTQSVDQEGYLLTTEWPLYVFDAALMFLLMVVFYIWYPHKIQPGRRNSWIQLMCRESS